MNSEVITVASYYGTGSSAITDYLSEFDVVKNVGDFEFRFAHDPDGLSDLEFNLIGNFNRHNTGHALKRYLRLVDYNSSHFYAKRYEVFFHGKWKEISYEYIRSLISFKYEGVWQYDFYDKGNIYDVFCKGITRVIKKIKRKEEDDWVFYPGDKEIFACQLDEKEFIEKTVNYTSKLISAINEERKPYVILDQLLPSSNIKRHSRYFKNIKVFLVDRDPRDLFILGKYKWHSAIVPQDVKIFCQWYRYNRITKREEIKNDNVLAIQFEDLIYRYEYTTNRIKKWIGLSEDSHAHKKSFFDPEVSMMNTQVWRNNEKYKDEIDYIEKQLIEFLYDFKGL